MRVDLFDFELPPELIAQRPAEPRDSSRLLHVTGDGLADRMIRDLPLLLQPGDLLVCNDTRVLPCRLRGKRGEAGIEATLVKPLSGDSWRALARPAKKLRPGDRIIFAEDFSAEVIDTPDGGELTLRFNRADGELFTALERHGIMPLPPYIKRDRDGDPADGATYQTLFADKPGAVAAPTAGLHFTTELMAALAERGVGTALVTLHVGAGTFLPVRVDDTDEHVMHGEWGALSEATAAMVNQTRADGGRIVAVGSTALRLLETAANDAGHLAPFSGDTSLFITPGYSFKAVDLMLTNFHLPRSTLFMLVAALVGLDRISAAYAHAIAERYRFFSYGDACLLEIAGPTG